MRFQAWVLVPLQGAAALGSLRAGAAAVCAWELWCLCGCRVPLLCVCLGTGWYRCCLRMGAGAAAGCVRLGCLAVCTWELGAGSVRFGGWCCCRVSLKGAAASCDMSLALCALNFGCSHR